MQVVREFVRFHSNERRLDRIDRTIELFEPDIAQRFGKQALYVIEVIGPERPATAHKVFPHAGLRFVDAQRHGFARRRECVCRRQSLLVERVARLVHGAEHGGRKEVLLVSCRDSHVAAAADGQAEWMDGHVDSSRAEVELERLGHVPRKLFLYRTGIIPCQNRGIGLLRCRHQFAEKLGRSVAEFGEQFFELRSPRARLEFVHQRIVGFGFVADVLGHAPLQFEQLFQVRREVRELGLLASFGPYTLGNGTGVRDLFDQLRGNAGCAIERASCLTEIGLGNMVVLR